MKSSQYFYPPYVSVLPSLP